ncbi:protein-tyrosine phosphatase family protein [Roseococcus pinisoli]|uniref:Tyrosine-protein phosphatase n=1 Tax=Roseococcus pinisoli TaxID=2835040 RepID=A0ABS5QF96_9PROT|nr:tyrosine-protein phosphatase [Roseococcus pinisoli]MBS7812369.1 tyrosine-protein phosphatase [Roseococcus pinisoli]
MAKKDPAEFTAQSFGSSPERFSKQKPKINGSLTIPVDGHDVTIFGGPFDACPKKAYSVCLEVHSALADSATILLHAPDFGTPDPQETRDAMRQLWEAMREAPNSVYYVGCMAGQGRTGLFLALMARLAGIEDPVGYVRREYYRAAVETPTQQKFVRDLDLTGLIAPRRIVAGAISAGRITADPVTVDQEQAVAAAPVHPGAHSIFSFWPRFFRTLFLPGR